LQATERHLLAERAKDAVHGIPTDAIRLDLPRCIQNTEMVFNINNMRMKSEEDGF